jgi:protein N-lysine methyltransferase METTL21D
LRLYEKEIDIYYIWVSEVTPSPSQGFKAGKLTTWKGSASAYKPVSIPLPTGARAGELWRLALLPSPTGSSLSSDAPLISVLPSTTGSIQSSFGRLPLPVFSAPMRIEQGSPGKLDSGKAKSMGKNDGPNMASKQQRIERFYTLPSAVKSLDSDVGLEEHSRRIMRITEQTSFDLDKVGRSRLSLADISPRRN